MQFYPQISEIHKEFLDMCKTAESLPDVWRAVSRKFLRLKYM